MWADLDMDRPRTSLLAKLNSDVIVLIISYLDSDDEDALALADPFLENMTYGTLWLKKFFEYSRFDCSEIYWENRLTNRFSKRINHQTRPRFWGRDLAHVNRTGYRIVLSRGKYDPESIVYPFHATAVFCTPEIEPGVTVQIVARENCIAVLDGKGNVFVTRFTDGARSKVVNMKFNQISSDEALPKVYQVAVSDCGLYALDVNNRLWRSTHWFTDFSPESARSFQCLAVNSANQAIRKIVATEGHNFALLHSRGEVIVWKDTSGGDGNVTSAELKLSNDVEIADIEATSLMLLLLTTTGQLLYLPIGPDFIEAVMIPGCGIQYLTLNMFHEMDEGPWTGIAAAFGKIGALSKSGVIVWATLGTDGRFHTFSSTTLPNKDTPVSLKFGAEHFLALGVSGAVYSWGKDTVGSGSLGLGDPEDCGKFAHPLARVTCKFTGANMSAEAPVPLMFEDEYFEEDPLACAVQIAASAYGSFAIMLECTPYEIYYDTEEDC